MGLISISNNVNNKLDYSFIIPESLYTTYREANKKLTDDFSKAISSSENSTNELTKDEAVQLANNTSLVLMVQMLSRSSLIPKIAILIT